MSNSDSDPMDISPPLPSTPPVLRLLPEHSPTQYKSEAIVISSDSESSEDDLEGWRGTRTRSPVRRQKPSRRYNKHTAARMNNNYTALDHVTTSRPTPNPPITVLLALTPQPATLADQAAFEEFAARFSADFSNFCIEEMWSCISLYSHYREWAQRNQEFNERHRGDQDDATPPSMGPNGSGSGTTTSITTTAATTSLSRYAIAEAEISTIHPFALRTRLEQETEVHWEFFLPVLQRLIEREVAQGMRLFVIGGLKLGDVEGVRAFARKIAEPSGILAFLPSGGVSSKFAIVPGEFESRSAIVASPPHPSQAYNMVLAALYAKCFPRVSRRVTVLDLTGDSSSSDEDESGVQEFDGEDRVMSGS